MVELVELVKLGPLQQIWLSFGSPEGVKVNKRWNSNEITRGGEGQGYFHLR